MTRDQLLGLLSRHGIAYQASGTDEVGVRCPRCVPRHDVHRRRLTLNINTRSWRWHCVRCEVKTAGRDAASFLRLLSVPYVDQPDLPLVADETFDHAATFGAPAHASPTKIPLPPEFRQDWDATVTGRRVLRYLQRRLTPEAIAASGVGYAVSGRAAGCAVFPVVQDRELMFWQARQVLLNGPKYVNPPGAPKSWALYGLDWLHGPRAVLVEGIFDALCTPDGLALFGKAISDRQLALLMKRGVSDVEIRLDSDALAAAKAVALQVARTLPAVNGRVTIAVLPPGADPADTSDIIDRISFII